MDLRDIDYDNVNLRIIMNTNCEKCIIAMILLNIDNHINDKIVI